MEPTTIYIEHLPDGFFNLYVGRIKYTNCYLSTPDTIWSKVPFEDVIQVEPIPILRYKMETKNEPSAMD